MRNKIIILFTTLLLAGCSSLSLYKIKHVFVKPPQNIYSEVIVPKPININMYLSASSEQREQMCLDSIQEHQDAFYVLYTSRQALSKWIDKQESIYHFK